MPQRKPLVENKVKYLKKKSSPTPQLKSVNSVALNLLYGPTITFIHDYWQNDSFDYMDLCRQSDVSAFNILFRFLIVFLLRSKCLYIS